MNVGLFGGTGFVGSNLVNHLISANYSPYLLIRPGSQNKLNCNLGKVHLISGDIDDEKKVKIVLENSDIIIYNIGIIREFHSSGITYKKLHFEGLKRVVDLCKNYKIKRFILMSANGVEKQRTGYEIFKFQAEEYLKKSNLEWTIFRPSLIFGDSKGKAEFCHQLVRDMILPPIPAPLFFKKIFFWKAGKFLMSPIHIDNVCDFFVKSIKMDLCINKTYELGGLENFNWKQIIKIISSMKNKNKIVVPAPIEPIQLVAKLFGRFSWFPITADQLTMLIDGNICDSKEHFETFNIDFIPFDKDSLDYLV